MMRIQLLRLVIRLARLIALVLFFVLVRAVLAIRDELAEIKRLLADKR